MTDKRLVCEVGEFVGRGEDVRRGLGSDVTKLCGPRVLVREARRPGLEGSLFAALGANEMEGSRI